MNNAGQEIYELIEELYPICRSISGDGVRQSLMILQKHIPVKINQVSTGTEVYDWTIPKEWNIKDAYIKNSKGEKIVDFKKSNLHVLNYSIPVNKKLSLDDLKKHLFTLPEHPSWIPYRTSYYEDNWGFCLPHEQYEQLKDDVYEVIIDSKKEDGFLTYGEISLRGRLEDEVLVTCYLCHPSLCNDSLSGVALVTFLAKYLKEMKLEYSYRFLFIPETIGAIAWLKLNEEKVNRIKHGLVVTCAGDRGAMTYKRTRSGKAEIDRVVEKALFDSGHHYSISEFTPTGSDERQFCSPGFNMNVGSLMRTPYACFPEYHTSADDLNFISPEHLGDSFMKYMDVIYILENNRTYLNLNPKCEPQLGKRGLLDMIGAKKEVELDKKAMLWVLNLSDGSNSLLDIAIRSGLSFKHIKNASDVLCQNGLLKKNSRDYGKNTGELK